jgi:hypothetical protein
VPKYFVSEAVVEEQDGHLLVRRTMQYMKVDYFAYYHIIVSNLDIIEVFVIRFSNCRFSLVER